MGTAILEVSQAGSPGILAGISAAQVPVKARSRTPGGIGPDPSWQLNSGRTAAPCDMGKEWAVVQQAIAGDADAQEHLFARHTRRLYRIVLALLNNKEDAEDALQEGLCKAFTSLRTFQGRSSFSTWLTRVVINSALMARRRKNNHPEASLDEMMGSQLKQMPRGFVDPRPGPEELYAETEFNTRIKEHVNRLPPALQTALRLHAIYGFSVPHSGEVLGISASAIKSRVFRARLRLACGLRRSLEMSAIPLVLRKSGCRNIKG
ncbi:MAG: sigma-70 family RNA polymerase sigma factor [Terriglobia bacterium]